MDKIKFSFIGKIKIKSSNIKKNCNKFTLWLKYDLIMNNSL